MSIRDIIEAADAHGWYSANAFASPTDGRFIATFDPEHVALMEAELQAGRHAWGFQHWPHAALAYNEARDALTAYRKERRL